MSEGFLDYHPAPLAVGLVQKPRGTKLLHDRREEFRGGGEVVQIVAARAVVFVDLRQEVTESLVGVCILKISPQIVDAAYEPVPEVRINLAGGEFVHVLGELFPEGFVGHLTAGEADHGK